MKKILLITATLMQAISYGQSLPNGSFENWSSISYNDPTGWNTGNFRDIQRMGVGSVTKVTGVTGFGIRIQNNMIGADTSDSYIINTTSPCTDPAQWTGGVSYTQQPTAITGKFRYNLLGNDTAILLVIFRKNGAHIGDNYIKIRGTGVQNAFTSFSYTLACSAVPDSLIIAAASSDKTNNATSQNGSYIEFDNLAFTGASQIIPNGDFENWTSKFYDIPAAWSPWGNAANQSTVSYAGTYAVRLQSTTDNCGGPRESGITTGKMTSNNGPKGGRPYVKMNDTLCGYYKYTPSGLDSAIIYINLTKNGANIGGTLKKLKASGSYTYFQIPFSAGTTPDSMRIDIQSSNWNLSASNVGSVLYVDNIYLKSQPTGIFENGISASRVIAFPNPAKDILNISSEKFIAATSVLVYDALGRCAKSQEILPNTELISIDISNLNSGVYYYVINSGNGNIIRDKFVKE